jgi:hypothetical protein
MEQLNEKYVGKYYGSDKIDSIRVIEDVTPLGSAIFEIVLSSNGRKVIIPEKGLVATVTDEQKDFNHLRDSRVNLMTKEILDLINEYDLPISQVSYLAAVVTAEVGGRFSRAMNYFWTGNDKLFVPGFDHENDVSVLMATNFVKNIPKE